MKGNQITFMNDLSNKIMSEVCDLNSFFRNKTRDGIKAAIDPMDLKIFYVFKNTKEGKQKKKKKSKSKSIEDRNKSKDTISTGAEEQINFSLREISVLDTVDLNSKIFTFDSKLSKDDLTKMNVESKNLDLVIKNLKCMKGIDIDQIPTFKFFQFKKSLVKGQKQGDDQVMLSFNDISQKILYDTSKAEGELLSLINSTISHEMRNPLNSIINQCTILAAMGNQFIQILTTCQATIPSTVYC